jgi:hypothetical protein
MMCSVIVDILFFRCPPGLGGFAGAGLTLLWGELGGCSFTASSPELGQIFLDGVRLHKIYSSTMRNGRAKLLLTMRSRRA